MKSNTPTTQKCKNFTGTWFSNTSKYHQALFICTNLKEAKKSAQIYKKRNNINSATIVTINK
jgi:hypothetical protein